MKGDFFREKYAHLKGERKFETKNMYPASTFRALSIRTVSLCLYKTGIFCCCHVWHFQLPLQGVQGVLIKATNGYSFIVNLELHAGDI